MWGHVWQMACREEQIPEVGDSVLYEIADWSLIVVRTAPDTISAVPQLVPAPRHPAAHPLRSTSSLPLPVPRVHLEPRRHPPRDPLGVGLPARSTRRRSACPRRRSGHGAGSCSSTSTRRRHRSRTTSRTCPAHFAAVAPRGALPHRPRRPDMPCNWKVALEAFIEAYHTMAVHPQLLTTAADSLTEYDVYGPHVSRMITAVGISSEHLDRQLDDVEIVRAMLGSKRRRGDRRTGIERTTGARRTRPRLAAQAHRPRLLGRHRRRAARRHRVLPVPELHAVGRLPDVVRLPLPPRRPRSRLVRDRHHGARADPRRCGPPAAPPRPGYIGPDETWADVARARRLRAGVQPGRLDVRPGAARAAGVGAAHDDAGPLPGEPDPALPRDPRRLPRARPTDGRPLHPRASRRCATPWRRSSTGSAREAVGQLDDVERARQARRHHRSRRLAGAAHRRHRAAPRGHRASRSRSSPRSSRGAWPTPRSSGRRSPPSSVELAGAPARRRARDRGAAARPVRRWRAPNEHAVAIDAAYADSALVLADSTTPSVSVPVVGRDQRRRPHPADGCRSSPPRASCSARSPSRRHRPLDRAGTDGHRCGPRRHDAGRHRPDLRLRHGAHTSSVDRSDRSRPCSTCWPTPSSTSRDHAPRCCTPHGPSTPSTPADALAAAASAKAYAVTAPRERCTRSPSRSTAASATRGSAWPTSTCAGPCCRPTCCGGVGPQPRHACSPTPELREVT